MRLPQPESSLEVGEPGLSPAWHCERRLNAASGGSVLNQPLDFICIHSYRGNMNVAHLHEFMCSEWSVELGTQLDPSPNTE